MSHGAVLHILVSHGTVLYKQMRKRKASMKQKHEAYERKKAEEEKGLKLKRRELQREKYREEAKRKKSDGQQGANKRGRKG